MKDSIYFQTRIAEGLKTIRHQRRLTQGEMARLLQISQPQFSKIENAQGSLTAEQFLQLIQHYNIPLNLFLPLDETDTGESNLKNALHQFGARWLTIQPEAWVLERYQSFTPVLFDTLSSHPLPEFLLSLPPLLIRNYQQIHFTQLSAQMIEVLGSDNRLWWLLESTLQSLQNRLETPVASPKLLKLYQHCRTDLIAKVIFKERIKKIATHLSLPEDPLNETITSPKELTNLKAHRDVLAVKWRIVTAIRQNDFDLSLNSKEKYIIN